MAGPSISIINFWTVTLIMKSAVTRVIHLSIVIDSNSSGSTRGPTREPESDRTEMGTRKVEKESHGALLKARGGF